MRNINSIPHSDPLAFFLTWTAYGSWLPGDGRGWALHPAMTELKALYDGGRLAVMANVGTLSQPLTKALYNSRPDLRPRQLFSHNDQQV